eukprot:CAMPEP_0113413916 /NCGR_PEP_ID=MMETSP0013_2-20120614/23720_1 /TAXON_ID=2843 ORGANISM="Skeletonema costatum, Strain 1716" /NCGR_SAMPLE_ID=MMETSP0013_2 /ASSEMBLY_ACC=CAM_ASM_000158 /LENGTH=179 /DNA_ID=CAMNT_0000300701 /DNA_START=34 /DNA_END=573 /DNA_ORIENTATION=- /assembly_acc=CAM_ASM_000158
MFRLVASRSKSIRPIASCVDSFAARAFSRQSSAVAASSQYQIPTSAFPLHQRQFSSSHDDFSPQKKHNLDGNENESEIIKMIDSHVKANNIMLYMKGSPSQPMCGFSATVVQILKSTGCDFASVNVLDYPDVREGVKKYAQWPTIPQLYVNGEFVGGCDIIKDMHESGELKELLEEVKE